jgi:hypothetical protein
MGIFDALKLVGAIAGDVAGELVLGRDGMDALRGTGPLTENEYSFSDLAKSREFQYREFDEIITRVIGKNEESNKYHHKELICLCKIFLYNFHYPEWQDWHNSSDKYLAYSLSFYSAYLEFGLNGQDDVIPINTFEKRARELFREYFPDLFEKDQDDYYKKAIHSFVTGETIIPIDQGIVKSINLLKKYLFLSENLDKYVKRGYESLQNDEKQRKLEEAEKKRLAEEKERQRQKRLEAEEARIQKEIAAEEAAEQRKKDRLLHADDDL